MPALELAVPPAAAGERLDRYLAGLPAVGSRAEAERLLALGRVSVDGRLRAKSYRLAGGEQIDVEPLERSVARREPHEVAGIEIRFVDEYLLVVDKPAGVVVHPGAGRSTRTLVHGLLAQGIGGGDQADRPGIVHRLDRDTSGLMVVARNAESHRRL